MELINQPDDFGITPVYLAMQKWVAAGEGVGSVAGLTWRFPPRTLCAPHGVMHHECWFQSLQPSLAGRNGYMKLKAADARRKALLPTHCVQGEGGQGGIPVPDGPRREVQPIDSYVEPLGVAVNKMRNSFARMCFVTHPKLHALQNRSGA